jgi:hypothetical protein
MDKLTLVSNLKNIIDNPSLSVDLYLVYKNGNNYIQYLSDPDQSLRDKIIKEFVHVLKIFTADGNPYELNDIYDDNEYEDYHLFFDDINSNLIANTVFNFDRSNTLPYRTDVGTLSKIYGFLIEISNGSESLTIYKRNQPTNAINPKNVINFFTGTDNKLELINQNAIYMNHQVDLFQINDTIFINSRSVYELQFGFSAELKTKAETSFVELAATDGFVFNEDLQEKVKMFPKAELKKLCNLTKNNPILERKNWKAVLSQAKKYAKHEFETDENGMIKVKSQKELKLLISILNRDFNMNEASKEKFLTKNKKPIK